MVAAGSDVVLIVPEGAGAGHGGRAAAGPGVPGGGAPAAGRLAVMVGDQADPAVRAAADEMDRELFGPAATSPPGPAPA